MPDRPSGDTLLAHLASKLSSRHEDIAVEALGYILKSDPARRAMEELARHGGADVGRIARVETQMVGDDKARPDLVGVDRQGRESLLIEAKFWAGLTENQPSAYLERSAKALLFVAPASRLESLWSTLRQRAGVESSRPRVEMTELKSATIGEERHLMLTSWAHLLKSLEAAVDSHTKVDIDQLRGFANRIDDESEFLPLRSEDFAPAVPRRLLSLRRLVDDATIRSVDAGFADTEGLVVTPQARGYGRYMRISDAGVWFGIGFDWWAQGAYADTPLWLYFGKWRSGKTISLDQVRRALEPLIQRDPPECVDEGRAILVPIELPTGVEYEEVVNAVVRRIQGVSRLIHAVGSADGSS